jgi:hypothetical protein
MWNMLPQPVKVALVIAGGLILLLIFTGRAAEAAAAVSTTAHGLAVGAEAIIVFIKALFA